MNSPVRKALSPVGVEAIHRDEIPSLIEKVGKMAGIPVMDLHPLGSTGKEPISGDVDLAVDTKWYVPETINNYITAELGEENTYYNAGTKVYSYAVPVNNKKVQVDLMFTPHLEWTKFAFYSDGISNGRTEYKGAIRTILLRAATAFASEPGVDLKIYDYGPEQELLINVGRTFDFFKGLRRIYQYRPQRKKPSHDKGTFVKKMTSVTSLAELKLACRGRVPDLSIKETVITDPIQALALVFPGMKLTPDDVRTAEQLVEHLNTSAFAPEIRRRIILKAKEKMASVADKMRTIKL